eukprot:SAG11_NODE_23158_length_394_cov_0.698305_1_plen_85_part_10
MTVNLHLQARIQHPDFRDRDARVRRAHPQLPPLPGGVITNESSSMTLADFSMASQVSSVDLRSDGADRKRKSPHFMVLADFDDET